MADVFQKVTGLDIQGKIGQQPYILGVIVVTGIAGFVFMPWTCALWAITAIKIVHYVGNLKEKGPFGD